MIIIVMQGENVLSPFKINKIFQAAEKLNLSLGSDIKTNDWYFIETNSELTAEEIRKLEFILKAKTILISELLQSSNQMVVCPRVGTVSPWASKATDIIHHIGFSQINRVERGTYYHFLDFDSDILEKYLPLIFDRMTESVLKTEQDIFRLFLHQKPTTFLEIDILNQGIETLVKIDQSLGLALSPDEIHYLFSHYMKMKRNPTDVELMMFAQANSEHCRHKIFNAEFIINNEKMPHTLFSMIKHTHKTNPEGTIVAYTDNSSVIEGRTVHRFYTDSNHRYQFHKKLTHVLMKVETHNHPTAISPFAGAATGSGGEIRDEGATGCGAKPKAGLCGFSVSNLLIPEHIQSWEYLTGHSWYGKPSRIASALQIMIEGPIGSAAFNNEFGRPNLLGYFRTFEVLFNGKLRGYHKPIMIAGGLGNIDANQTVKKDIPPKSILIQLGGPGFLIGLGGGAASSMFTGTNEENLDFDSVQRGNPEMERRCQEVIDHCWQLGEENPILAIHDVGAGGLSNAFPELVNDVHKGAIFQLRDIPIEEKGMSPKEIWCNESQERYVLAILPEKLNLFKQICERERCPFAVVGEATEERILKVEDSFFNNQPVHLALDILLGKPPKSKRRDRDIEVPTKEWSDLGKLSIKEALYQVLNLPAVASKNFLITIGDRTVGGLTHRDQMIGPYQVPIADCAITNMGFNTHIGEVMSMGERTPLALINGPASARMAIGEAITNMMSAYIGSLSAIKLSANWMASCGVEGEDAKLYRTVEATCLLCNKLGISIPVGKDSLSMQTVWQEDRIEKSVTSPLSLIISAFAVTDDVRLSITPEIQNISESILVLVDFSCFKNRIGFSALAQVFKNYDSQVPDFDNIEEAKIIFKIIQHFIRERKILALHDRSDGGLIVTLIEMMFASRLGININCDELIAKTLKNYQFSPEEVVVRSLFNEELGIVFQIKNTNVDEIFEEFKKLGVSDYISTIGTINHQEKIIIQFNGKEIINESRESLQKIWSNTSYQIQKLRDNPVDAEQEFESISHEKGKLFSKINFNLREINQIPVMNNGIKPKVAILREQGVNGHVEMAFAFRQAGFDVHDVHMSDLLNNRLKLSDFQILAACGGFSYGDVLGAGRGWANTILFHEVLQEQFIHFFERQDTLTLGVCNGCQMLSELRTLIPGTELWPKFKKNHSEQYEARLVMVNIQPTNSLFLNEMIDSSLPIVVSHGEGRADFSHCSDMNYPVEMNQFAVPEKLDIALRYIDSEEKTSMLYPMNPNGSIAGIAGVTSQDGRVTIMMPHPERVVRNVQMSWHPNTWQGEYSPWFKMFVTARKYYQ